MCAHAQDDRLPAEPTSVNRAAIRRVVITGTVVGVPAGTAAALTRRIVGEDIS
jgi:hypothetical protein